MENEGGQTLQFFSHNHQQSPTITSACVSLEQTVLLLTGLLMGGMVLMHSWGEQARITQL